MLGEHLILETSVWDSLYARLFAEGAQTRIAGCFDIVSNRTVKTIY